MPKILGTERTVQTNTALLTPPSTAGFGASARGMQAVADGIGKFAGVADPFIAAKNKNDSVQADMDILDFKIKQDQRQHEAGRNIQDDGFGHVDQSNATYDQEAQTVLNKLPESQRAKGQLTLKRYKKQNQDAAQGQQVRHTDAHWTVKGVEYSQTLTGQMVTQEEVAQGGQAAAHAAIDTYGLSINKLAISPGLKGKLIGNHAKQVAKRYANVVDPVSYQKDLKARGSSDKSVGKEISLKNAPDYRGQKASAAIRYNNPGAQWPGPSAKKFGMTHSVTLNDGQNNKIAVFPTMVHGAAAQFDLLNRRYTGMTLGRAIKKWSGGNNWRGYVAGVTKRTGIGSSTVITKEMMQDPKFAITLTKAMSQHEANKKGVMSDQNWAQAHQYFMSGGKGKLMSMDNGASGIFTKELFSSANQKVVQKRFEDGIKLQVQASLKGKPSAALEKNADVLHDLSEKHPQNEGLQLILKETENFKKEQSKALRTDPLKYADDQGVLDVPSIFDKQDIGEALAQRIPIAEKVKDTYGIEPKFLKEDERAHLSYQFQELGFQEKMQFIAKIEKGAKGKAGKIFNEIAGTDPGMAHIGGLYLAGRSETATLAMRGLEMMKDKSLRDVVSNLKEADISSAYQGVFGNTFNLSQMKKSGPFITTAKSIAVALIVQGKHDDPADALEEGMKLATGQREINGDQYGGVIEFNDQSVLLHPDHKADDVEDVFDFLTSRENHSRTEAPSALGQLGVGGLFGSNEKDGDINKNALNYFLQKDGVNPTNTLTQRPVTAEDMNDAKFVSVGPGRFLIMIDGVALKDTRTNEKTNESTTLFRDEYVLDLSNGLEDSQKLMQ